jgi:hypothetical protein
LCGEVAPTKKKWKYVVSAIYRNIK